MRRIPLQHVATPISAGSTVARRLFAIAGRLSRPALVTSILVILTLLAWSPLVLNRVDPVTGDEPDYLMTTISLLADGDLDQANQFAGRAFEEFDYPALAPRPSETAKSGLYSPHPPGLSAVIAPAYALGGREGVVFALIVAAGLLAANITLLAQRYTASGWLAGAIGGLLALTSPLATFSPLIYPEIVAALGVIYAARRLLAEGNSRWQWVAVSGCAALLPWLNYRFVVVSLALAAVAVMRHRAAFDRRTAVAALSLPVASAVLLIVWLSLLYGRPLPAESDYRGFVGLLGVLNGALATWLDRQSGALVYNTLLGLGLICSIPFARHRRGDAIALGTIALPYLLLIATYREWWGGWSPPGRLLVAVVPMLAAPLAWWLSTVSRRWRWATLAGFAVPTIVAMVVIGADPHPSRIYGGNSIGTSDLADSWGRWLGMGLIDPVPSFIESNPSSVAHRLVVAFGLLALLAVMAHLAQHLAERAIDPRGVRVSPLLAAVESLPSSRLVGWTRHGAAAIARSRVVAAWWRPLLVTTAFAVAAVVMTWPYATQLDHATAVGPDPLLQIWLARWIQHALVTAPLDLFDANIFYPFEHTLAYTDANIPGALIAAPLYLLTGDPILVNSLLTLATFLVAAGGMYALVGHLTGNRAVGFLCGLAYAFVPYRFVRLWHLNQLEHAWTPWIMLALLLLIARPTWRRSALLGVLLVIQILTSFYLAFQAALVVGIVLAVAVVVDRRVRQRRFLAHLAVTLGLVGLVVVPLYWPYLEVRGQQGLERTLAEAEFWKATPGSYLTLQPWNETSPVLAAVGIEPGTNRAGGLARHGDGHRHLEIVIEDALFPGLVVLIGAVIGLFAWRRRAMVLALATIGMVAFILSLGPTLGPVDGSGIPLPYKPLFEQVAFFKAMRVPARLGALVIFALVVLAGGGAVTVWRAIARRWTGPPAWLPPAFARERRWTVLRGAIATGAVALLIVLEFYGGSVPLEAVDRSTTVAAPYEWLAKQPGNDAVMEFPADSLVVGESASSARRHAGLAMYWSTLHWKPIVNGVSGFQPLGNALYLDAFLGDLIRSDGTVAKRVSHVSAETVGLLQQLGVRYVVIHRSQYAPGDWPAVERELERAEGALEKAGDFGEARIYLVKEPARPPVTASLTLAVPKAVDPHHAWEPWLLIRNPGETPSLFNIDRSLTLTTRWFDDAGEEVARQEAKPKWPVVAWPGQTACSLNLCRGATDDDRPPARSAPDGATPPYPTSEGRYQVRLELSGAVAATCEVEVEVTTEIAPNDATSWWECASGEPDRSPALIEEPWAATPAMLVINRTVSLVTTFINPSDAEVRAWFYLSRPGEDEPWTHYLHQSAPVQRLVRAGQPAEFGWVEAVDVPDGVYDLTVWFHVKRGDEWVHALGGDLGLGRVVIARERGTAGSFRIVPWERRVMARDGAHATVRLAALGSAPGETCRTTWTLTTVGTEQAPARPLSWGQSKDCGVVRPAIPPNLEPGRYRVELTAFATGEEGSRRSDRIAVDVIVVDWSPW